jgi:hypothetical protein
LASISVMGLLARIGAWVLAVALVVASGAVLVGLGSAEDRERPHVIAPITNEVAFDPAGDTVDLATGWLRAADRLAPELLDPHEILAVSSFPLPAEGHAGACVGDAPPGKALGAMAADDALIWIVEWTPLPAPDDARVPKVATTDTRPVRFSSEQFASRDCVTLVFPHLVGKDLMFKDQHRVFEVFVAYGDSISPSRHQEIYETLDSLRFRST